MKALKRFNKKKKRNYLEMKNDPDIIYIPQKKDEAKFNTIKNKKLKIQYNINIESKYEINNLQGHPSIKKSNLVNNLTQLSALKYNELFILENLSKKIIKNNLFFSREIEPDGNCYYRALSYYLTNSQNYYKYFRIIYIII